MHRRGHVVVRDTGPWMPAVHALLRHLEAVGFAAAGPVDPLVELAQLCWLNAKLHDDIVAGLEGSPPLAERAGQLAAIADGYGLAARERARLVTTIIELAIAGTAAEADDARVTPETTSHPVACWAMAWRARSAAWMIRHRAILESAVERGI